MQQIEDRYGHSLWYAWGRIDSGQYGNRLNTDHGFKFAREQREAARQFYQEESVSSLDSILGSWDKFVKRELES